MTQNSPRLRSSDGGNDNKKPDRSPYDSRASHSVPWGKPLTGQVRHRLNTRLDQAFLKRRQATEPIFVIEYFLGNLKPARITSGKRAQKFSMNYFTTAVQDLYFAEKKILVALPKLVKAAEWPLPILSL